MSAKTADTAGTSGTAGSGATRTLRVDEESRALMASPAFRELLEAGRASASQGLLSEEDLDRQRPISDEDAAEADERIARLMAEDEPEDEATAPPTRPADGNGRRRR